MNDGPSNQEYAAGSFWLQPSRCTSPVIVVVCDDTKTAPRYFAAIKREVKEYVTVHVERAPHCGATANQVLDHAVAKKRSHAAKEGGDAVWALIDMEAEPRKKNQARECQRRAAEIGIKVALSNPCFEVWTLAHLCEIGQSFDDCRSVVNSLELEWKRQFNEAFEKAQADYSKLRPFREKAMQRAAQRNPANDPSWTEVCRVVQAILTAARATGYCPAHS